MSAQDEYDKAVPVYAAGEKKSDESLKALLRVMRATLKVQDEASCDPDTPIHPTKFAETKEKIAEAISAQAAVSRLLAEAHVMGEKVCKDGGISTQGGGGGKAARIWRDFYLADAYRIEKQKHAFA